MFTLTPQQAFEQAVRDHLAGRLDAALVRCRAAVQQRPDVPEVHLLLGNVLLDKNQPEPAAAAFNQAIALRPDFVLAHFNLGRARMQMRQLDDAAAAVRQALAIQPAFPEGHNFLGLIFREAGRADEAIAAFNQAIAQRPDFPQAHYNLGIALFDTSDSEAAIARFRQAIALRPNYALAHNNLALSLQRVGRLDEAADAGQQAVHIFPAWAEAHYNLAGILHEAGRLEEATAECRLAISYQPDHAKAMDLLGTLLRWTGHYDEALIAYQKAIQLLPSSAGIRWNLGVLRLLLGDFQQGWQDYEARLKVADFPVRGGYPRPMWNGLPLTGRRILLHVEQGLGDAIQFIRYAPWVAARGGRVIVQCPAPVRRLFAGQAGIEEVVDDKDIPPPFDVHCPLMSLPRIFQTTATTIPAGPYLRAETGLAQSWRDRLLALPPGLKVGLAWAGNPSNRYDRSRSLHLQQLAPLAAIPGVQFLSLQKGPAAAQAQSPPAGMKIIDWPQAQDNFAQTAALMSNLDLIIAVDTAVAHLAGALGRPTWVLLPFAADWRWLLDRQDSPWYPTMRLFRQPAPGDWAAPLEEIRRKLADWMADPPAPHHASGRSVDASIHPSQ